MLATIPYFNPVLIEHLPVVGLPIHMFGVLVAIGILLAVPQVVKRGKQLGLDPVQTSSMCTWIVVVGFVVSHVFDVLTYQPGALKQNPWLIVDIRSGISSFGGFIGAFGTLIVWSRVKKVSLMKICDATMYGLATGWLFGRLGCFTAHDHPGTPTSFFLGVDYGTHGPGGVRHDLGLYEAMFTAVLLLAFRWMVRTPRRAGTYLAVACLSYGPVRFALDFLRVEDARYLGLTPAQWGSVAVFAAGIAVALRMRQTTGDDASLPATA